MRPRSVRKAIDTYSKLSTKVNNRHYHIQRRNPRHILRSILRLQSCSLESPVAPHQSYGCLLETAPNHFEVRLSGRLSFQTELTVREIGENWTGRHRCRWTSVVVIASTVFRFYIAGRAMSCAKMRWGAVGAIRFRARRVS